MPPTSGALWRIRRTGGPIGERPPKPRSVPLYALQAGAALVGAAAVLAGLVGLRRRRSR